MAHDATKSALCVTNNTAVLAHAGLERYDASQSVAGRSRWLVGSSRSKRPGRRKSACASAARMRQPPESVDKGASCALVEPETGEDAPRVRLRRVRVPPFQFLPNLAQSRRRGGPSVLRPRAVGFRGFHVRDEMRFLDEEFGDASIGTDQRLERGPVRGLELLRDARDVVDVRFDSTRGDEFDEG